MTARLPAEQRKIAARDDLTPKPRRPKRLRTAAVEMEKAIAKFNAAPLHNKAGTQEYANSKNSNRALTEKQRLFIKHWASGETILSASYRAGYADSGTMAYRLAKDPAILKIYYVEKAKYEEACQMTRKRVMDGLLDAVETAKMLGEPASMVAGWRTIGQMCGYFEPIKKKVEITVNGNITMKRLEQATDAELLKLINEEIEDVAFTETTGEEPADEE